MSARAVFELRNATVRYAGSREPQLADVSLTVAAGECVALVGPNGAGKTTALRALLGLVPLESGHALALGREVGLWRRPALAREVAAVGQREEPVFPIRVGEAVAMGRYPHLGPWRRFGRVDNDAVRDAMDRTDVTSLKGRWVQTLSGGEWQRVRLARALAQQPQALVLDEPTASLDLRHEMELLELVVGLVRERGLAAIIVSHHLNAAARFADRLALLSKGRLVLADVPARVLVPDVLTDVFGWPVAVHRLPDGAVQIHPERRPISGASA
ncbi:MAG: ABC transporter ATP-binding protein [Gemmatimonadales bacterium]